MRVAIVGAGHWHVGIYYLPALERLGADIVAISDPSDEVLAKVGADVAANCYHDYRELLDKEDVDLVMAHAPHDEMTELAAALVTRHQPFHMEKPMGVDWRKLEPIAVKAQTEGIFTSVALVSRYLGVVEQLAALKQAGRLGQVCHYYDRLLGGGPERYIDWGCPWMLDPAKAGGGPLFNFGAHLFDTLMYLSGQRIVEVYARFSRGLHPVDIEDMASVIMITEDGAIGIGEAGYIMPEGYERYFSLTTDTLHVGGDVASGEILFRDGTRLAFEGLDGDDVYFQYTADLLRRLEAGEPARATIQDMVEALRVINAASESARCGKPVALDTTGD